MTEKDLIGTWRKVSYGDTPFPGQHLVHLLPDGSAICEGEHQGKTYRTHSTWRLKRPDLWELRRTIPLGEIPEMEEESVEVDEHTVVEFDGLRMAVTKFDYEEPFHYERQPLAAQ
ncbi:MAG: hypothetical protein ACRC8S_09670 [Fimbriiglobus sp.]